MIRLWLRTRSSKSLSDFDLESVRSQLKNAQEYISKKLKHMDMNASPDDLREEAWTDQVLKAIKTEHPSLSPTKKDDTTLIVPFPAVSSDRKTQLLKEMKELLESGKQVVRNVRAEARSQLKSAKLPKDEDASHQAKIQKMVDASLGAIESLYNSKKKELEKGK